MVLIFRQSIIFTYQVFVYSSFQSLKNKHIFLWFIFEIHAFYFSNSLTIKFSPKQYAVVSETHLYFCWAPSEYLIGWFGLTRVLLLLITILLFSPNDVFCNAFMLKYALCHFSLTCLTLHRNPMPRTSLWWRWKYCKSKAFPPQPYRTFHASFHHNTSNHRSDKHCFYPQTAWFTAWFYYKPKHRSTRGTCDLHVNPDVSITSWQWEISHTLYGIRVTALPFAVCLLMVAPRELWRSFSFSCGSQSCNL